MRIFVSKLEAGARTAVRDIPLQKCYNPSEKGGQREAALANRSTPSFTMQRAVCYRSRSKVAAFAVTKSASNQSASGSTKGLTVGLASPKALVLLIAQLQL